MTRLFTAIVAFVAAFAGAALGIHATAEAQAKVVRATRFELVTDSGTLGGVWEATAAGTSLRLLRRDGGSGAELSLGRDELPVFSLFGRDGKKRLVMELSSDQQKPMIGLGDDKWEGRVRLGFIPPDSRTPTWDEWGLLLTPPGTERPAASIGIAPSKEGTRGYLTLSGRQIR